MAIDRTSHMLEGNADANLNSLRVDIRENMFCRAEHLSIAHSTLTFLLTFPGGRHFSLRRASKMLRQYDGKINHCKLRVLFVCLFCLIE